MPVLQKIFHHLKFTQPDPLGGGLAEEIAEEQAEPEAIDFQTDIDGEQLVAGWAKTADELEKDPDWIDFSKDE